MTYHSDTDILDDIFVEWKKNRFVVVDRELFPYEKNHIIILTDVAYFADHIDDVIEWCEHHMCKMSGMTVEIPSDEIMMLFTLKWS